MGRQDEEVDPKRLSLVPKALQQKGHAWLLGKVNLHFWEGTLIGPTARVLEIVVCPTDPKTLKSAKAMHDLAIQTRKLIEE